MPVASSLVGARGELTEDEPDEAEAGDHPGHRGQSRHDVVRSVVGGRGHLPRAPRAHEASPRLTGAPASGFDAPMAALSATTTAISFDYGHVLGGIDRRELAARLSTLAAAMHLAPPRGTEAEITAAMPDAYAAHDRAIADGLGHAGGWRALVGTLVDAGIGAPGLGQDERAAIVTALWEAQPTRNLWREVPASARQMLERLRAAGVPMVITSNSEGRVAELLEEVGIAHYFSTILDSGRLGFGKPDPRIFHLAAEALGAPIGQVVHVGDSEAADVIGALDAGMQALRFDGFVPHAAGRPTRAAAACATHEALTALLLAPFRARTGD